MREVVVALDAVAVDHFSAQFDGPLGEVGRGFAGRLVERNIFR